MPHILFAENGPTAMDLAGGLLEAANLTFDVVTDGRSLLDHVNADTHHYDAIVLAYELPEISGPECITFLKKMYRRLPILVLVENLTSDHTRELGQIGIRPKHIHAKPTDRTTFATWVQLSLNEAPPRRPTDSP
ncbi:MAG: response regulator [Candidatus Latescibacteria bacterium]|jgi:CheY-like chemotaxis protein|nr:response regulator [Candidatus Latescibacterota bacterium]